VRKSYVILIGGGTIQPLSFYAHLGLGGDHFGAKIMDYVLDCIKKEHGIDGRDNSRFMVTLKQQCEEAKIALSSIKSTDVIISGVLRGKTNEIIDIDVEIPRHYFNQMIADDIKKSINCVERAIARAKLTKDQIDNVLLVGGSTSIPYVQESLTKYFGLTEDVDTKKIFKGINPITCVAQGAAILASMSQTSHILCPTCFHGVNIDELVCTKCNYDLSHKWVPFQFMGRWIKVYVSRSKSDEMPD
jgi:molecular chaperone DnaK (HSP70)